ncbi:MAG: phosphoethanolamine transferase, partial [Muribaculaceae bacterium]|nr:phosphoethanolamine transferase [Muribaculaceae bacterium]
MIYLCYFLAALGLFGAVTLVYRLLSKGLSRSARGQQLTRYGVASLLAVAPLAIASVEKVQINLVLAGVVSLCWMLCFPLFDFIAGRKTKGEIDNRMDFAAGMYLFGLLSSSYLALTSLFPGWLTTIDTFYAAVELPLLVVCLFQVCYYFLYGSSVSHEGLKLVLDTNVNEVLEFIRSFPAWAMVAGVVAMIVFIILWFFWSIVYSFVPVELNWLTVSGEILLSLVFVSLLFKRKKGAFWRCGLPRMYSDNREYARQLSVYESHRRSRMNRLDVRSPLFPAGKGRGEGRTFVLVIGESASRDYMEAFSPVAENAGTSPWLSATESRRGATFLFPNAYSCHFQTVPTLERALTEMNQYNGKRFIDSVSLVELARGLGMEVYWYSNQGHIGVNDTPVTLVAESSQHARWTSQSVNHHPYDSELLNFMSEVKPEGDKFVVFHLKGSHFTYTNRYPAEAEFFATSGGDDYVAAYRNTIRYTDTLLGRIYDYACRNWNLQAMVYCS